MTLNEVAIGRKAVVSKVEGEGALRCRLLDMGIIPGTKIEIIKVAPMGDPIEIHLRSYELTIRLEEAEKIEVMPEEEDK